VRNGFDDSLRIIDVSNPAAPVIVGGVKDDTNLDSARSVAVSGRYAYVIAYVDDSLRIIDISNPTAPVIVGGVQDRRTLMARLGRCLRPVCVCGKLSRQLPPHHRCLEPCSTSIVGGVKDAIRISLLHNLRGCLRPVCVCGKLHDDSLRIIDVSNPTAPVIVGGVQDATNLRVVHTPSLSPDAMRMWRTNDDSLRIIDVSNPAAPVIVGGVKDATNLEWAHSVAVSGRYAYVEVMWTTPSASLMSRIQPHPVIVGGVKDATNLDGAYSVAVSGRYAYVANFTDDSLRIIDLGGIDSPAGNIGSLLAGNIDVDTLRGGNAFLTSVGIGQGGLYSQGAGTFSISVQPPHSRYSSTLSNRERYPCLVSR
jgi:hypothetical protein